VLVGVVNRRQVIHAIRSPRYRDAGATPAELARATRGWNSMLAHPLVVSPQVFARGGEHLEETGRADRLRLGNRRRAMSPFVPPTGAGARLALRGNNRAASSASPAAMPPPARPERSPRLVRRRTPADVPQRLLGAGRAATYHLAQIRRSRVTGDRSGRQRRDGSVGSLELCRKKPVAPRARHGCLDRRGSTHGVIRRLYRPDEAFRLCNNALAVARF